MDNKDLLKKATVLASIISEYPEIWNNIRRFKALLADLFYEDEKAIRNLLVMSAETKIPHEMYFNRGKENVFDHEKYIKIFMRGYALPQETAEQIIVLWEYAFERALDIDFSCFKGIDIYGLFLNNNISEKLYCYLKEIGIYSLQDIFDSELYVGLQQGVSPFEDEIYSLLETYGNRNYRRRTSRRIADRRIESLNLGVRQRNGLYNFGVKNVRSIMDLIQADILLSVKNLGKKSIDIIENELLRIGVPKCCFIPVILYEASELEKAAKSRDIRSLFVNNEISACFYIFLKNNQIYSFSDFRASGLIVGLENDIAPYEEEVKYLIEKYSIPHGDPISKELVNGYIEELSLDYSKVEWLIEKGIWTVKDLVKWHRKEAVKHDGEYSVSDDYKIIRNALLKRHIPKICIAPIINRIKRDVRARLKQPT